MTNNRPTNPRADDIPTAPSDPLGLQTAGATVLSGDNAASETTATQQIAQPATNGLRIVDDGTRQAGVATATGTLEAVDDARSTTQNAPSASSDRYGRAVPTANDYRRLAPPNDVKTEESATNPLPRTAPAVVAAPQNALSSALPTSNVLQDSALAASRSPVAAASINGFSSNEMSPTAAAASPVNVEGLGRPGEKRLEGPQNPSVTIEKIAPPEIQVNKPATFQVVVRNTGPVPAENVEVTDVVPQGTQLISTTPKTMVGQRGEILWKVGDLKPNEEAKLQVDLMPLSEGEIGSTAVVQFRSTASMRTIATKPEVLLELTAPNKS